MSFRIDFCLTFEVRDGFFRRRSIGTGRRHGRMHTYEPIAGASSPGPQRRPAPFGQRLATKRVKQPRGGSLSAESISGSTARSRAHAWPTHRLPASNAYEASSVGQPREGKPPTSAQHRGITDTRRGCPRAHDGDALPGSAAEWHWTRRLRRGGLLPVSITSDAHGPGRARREGHEGRHEDPAERRRPGVHAAFYQVAVQE